MSRKNIWAKFQSIVDKIHHQQSKNFLARLTLYSMYLSLKKKSLRMMLDGCWRTNSKEEKNNEIYFRLLHSLWYLQGRHQFQYSQTKTQYASLGFVRLCFFSCLYTYFYFRQKTKNNVNSKWFFSLQEVCLRKGNSWKVRHFLCY